MSKFTKLVVAVALSVALALPFAGCATDTDKEKSEQQKIYELYVVDAESKGEEPLTYEEWLETIKGDTGAQGEKGDKGDTGAAGEDGKSAYEIAVENGFQGTEEEWLASLKGEQGDKGDTGAQGEKGDKGDTGAQGEKGDKGDTGAQGEKGDKGDTGAAGEDGKSAYEIAVENGFQGTEEEWLASLKGEQGDKGDTGAQGEKGDKGDTGAAGEDGVGISEITYETDKWGIGVSVVIKLTDGTETRIPFTGAANANKVYEAASAEDFAYLMQVGASQIKLIADFAADIVIEKGYTITLDLNGYTLTNIGDDTITNFGNLTVIDTSAEKSGTIDNITHAKAAINNEVGGRAYLSGGTFTRSAENGSSAEDNGGNSYYTLLNHGDMVIGDGVAVTQNGQFSSLVENGWYNGAQNTGAVPSNMIIKGGVFSGGLNTIKNDDYGYLTVEGGTFTNMAQAVVLNWNVANITGGNYEISGSSAQAFFLNGYLDDTMDKGYLDIKDVNCKGEVALFAKMSLGRTGGTIVVYEKETFAAALAVEKVKVVLGEDIVLGETIKIAQKATLDLNGKTIEISSSFMENSVIIRVEAGGDLTITGDGKIDATTAGEKSVPVAAMGGNITIESVTILVKTKYESCVYAMYGGKVTINGGTFINLSTEEYAYGGGDVLVLNVSNSAATSDIVVYGGTFLGRNPAAGDDNLGGTFVAEGYAAEATPDGLGYKVVKSAA